MVSHTPKVVVRLMGGLGNQLFQYALGRAIEIECGAHVSFDPSLISRKNGRVYMLDRFTTKLQIAETPSPSHFDRFLRFLGLGHYITERQLAYMPYLFSRIKHGGTFYLDGYWQTEKYFNAIRKEILAEITLATPLGEHAKAIARSIYESQSVALHVRRGDYAANMGAQTVHDVCGIAYYQRVLALMREKMPDAHFFIFSDDIRWVQENLDLDPAITTYVSGTGLSDEAELVLMSSCKHQIIANSTFSWWAAWLNQNPSKIVIAPQQWFTDPTKDTSDLIPASWLRL